MSYIKEPSKEATPDFIESRLFFGVVEENPLFLRAIHFFQRVKYQNLN